MEDKLLILRFKRGSTDALCRIYEKYEGIMLTVAAGLLNDVNGAQDAVHDVFVSLAQSPERLRLTGSLRSYLTTCVANLARDRLRAGEQTPNPDRRPVTCATRFFKVSQEEQGLWQSLRDQGIELVGVSTDPEVYYAALSPEQAQSFDASVTLKCLSAPRVTVLDGESAAIAVKDWTLQGPHGLAVAWLPTISSDGKEIQSTVSFHDGRNGFEIPNVSTESGGVVLIRARGIFPP
jgi:DNA-directed RNA polymerase specialized sigma24 family protein